MVPRDSFTWRNDGRGHVAEGRQGKLTGNDLRQVIENRSAADAVVSDCRHEASHVLKTWVDEGKAAAAFLILYMVLGRPCEC